jgi:hypothetical protein
MKGTVNSIARLSVLDNLCYKTEMINVEDAGGDAMGTSGEYAKL